MPCGATRIGPLNVKERRFWEAAWRLNLEPTLRRARNMPSAANAAIQDDAPTASAPTPPSKTLHQVRLRSRLAPLHVCVGQYRENRGIRDAEPSPRRQLPIHRFRTKGGLGELVRLSQQVAIVPARATIKSVCAVVWTGDSPVTLRVRLFVRKDDWVRVRDDGMSFAARVCGVL